MQLTNIHNYPPSLVEAAQVEIEGSKRHIFEYPGRMAITTLIDSPMIPRLLKQRYDDIIIDVDDFYEAIDGKVWDSFLSQNEPDNVHPQQKVELKVDGITVVGRLDICQPSEGIIADYKRCKVAALRYEHLSWERQLNCYAYLAEVVWGVEVKKLLIYPLLKDWRILPQWQKVQDYPANRCPAFELPLWSKEKREEYIKDQIYYHLAMRDGICGEEECWQKGDEWAVMKAGRKVALRVLSSFAECESWCNTNGINLLKNPEISIVKREGEDVRCMYYCPVRSVCSFKKGEGKSG